MDLNGEEIVGTFYEKELQKTNQEEFKIEKVIKKKVRNCISDGKAMIIHLIAELIKKIFYETSQYFPKPYRTFVGNINVKVDLSNYAGEADLKGATGVDTFKLVAKSDLASLKAEIDKIDIDKLNTAPADLSKLSNLVNNEVVKKPVNDKLVAKVNNIDISGFLSKTKYNTDKSSLEKKISNADKQNS